MPLSCYVDLETSGLPLKRSHMGSNYEDTKMYDTCRIVSMAVIFVEDNGNAELKELGSFDMLFKPEGFLIPEGLIHGITHEKASTEGTLFTQNMEKIRPFMRQCKYFTAYNADFDWNVLQSEFRRRGMKEYEDLFNVYEQVCVMKSASFILKTNKWMKLSDLYYNFFKETFNAHDAMEDIRATIAVHRKLREIMLSKLHK
jgi:DNA polymerase III epsilon subunit-like protein